MASNRGQLGMKEEYTVHLERIFEGPMDLLLHLVREQEVEIQEEELLKEEPPKEVVIPNET